jgi:hypothetical protein
MTPEKAREIWPAFLDSKEFYDLMQIYRTTLTSEFKAVNAAYDAVRFFIRDQRDSAFEQACRERDALKAKCSRESKQLDESNDACVRLSLERDRLKSALERIARMSPEGLPSSWSKIASEALGLTEK